MTLLTSRTRDVLDDTKDTSDTNNINNLNDANDDSKNTNDAMFWDLFYKVLAYFVLLFCPFPANLVIFILHYPMIHYGNWLNFWCADPKADPMQVSIFHMLIALQHWQVWKHVIPPQLKLSSCTNQVLHF